MDLNQEIVVDQMANLNLEQNLEQEPAQLPAGGEEAAPEFSGESVRLFIGNLPWSVSWQDLKDFVRGSVETVSFTKVMRFPDGRSKGCGLVEFENPEDARKAMEELNGAILRNRKVFIREDRKVQGGPDGAEDGDVKKDQGPKKARAPRQPRAPRGQQQQQQDGVEPVKHECSGQQLYVGNLPWDSNNDDLRAVFEAYGTVELCEMQVNQYSGRSKGFALVRYTNTQDAEAAIANLNDTDFGERRMSVRLDKFN